EESIANAIRSWGNPGCSLQLMKEGLAEPSPSWSNIDEENLDVGERNVKQCKRKIYDGHYTTAVRVLSSSGVAPYNDATLEDLKTKHPLKPAPSLPHIPIHYHQLTASPAVVLDMIKSFPRGTSYELVSFITQVVNLFLDRKCPKTLGEYIASAPLTSLVKPGGGIRTIVVGTVWRRLVSKVSVTMIGHSLDSYLNDLQFSVRVLRGGEAILHVVNHLIEDRGDEAGLSMLLVEFCYFTLARLYYGEHTLRSYQGVQQGDPLGPLLFALVLHPLVSKIRDSFNLSLQAWYLDDGTIIGDTLVVGEVLKVIIEDEPRRGLHLNVDKTKVFWPKEDPRSRFAGVFPLNIASPLHGVKLLGGPPSANFNFSCELVMKRVSKSIVLMDTIAKLNDP
ncbi:putative reverse transcriptase domain-containing protein, partial [Tanacetum coccineum]